MMTRFFFDRGERSLLVTALAPARVARCRGCRHLQQWSGHLACMSPAGEACAQERTDAFEAYEVPRILAGTLDADGQICVEFDGEDGPPPLQAHTFQALELRRSTFFACLSAEQADALQDSAKLPPDRTHRTLYYGEYAGFVAYYVHDPENQRGYGGEVHRFHMTDGTQRLIKGPWSGGPALLQQCGLAPVRAAYAWYPGGRVRVGTTLRRIRRSFHLTEERAQALLADT